MKRSKETKAKSCCSLQSIPRLRLATDAQTDAIKDNFPSGIAKPALRALAAAGINTLDDLAQVSELELAEMHGMGPSAITKLHAGLKERGLDFKTS